MLVVWEKSVTLPDFSINCREIWVNVEPVFETNKDSHIGWNRLEIQPARMADLPKDADHAIIKGQRGITKHAFSSIEIPGPTVIESIEIYKFTVANPESENEVVEFDGCLSIIFDDGHRFAISSYQAPMRTLGFTMEEADINQLANLSSKSMLIT